MKELIVHPEGKSRNGPLVPVSRPVAVDIPIPRRCPHPAARNRKFGQSIHN
jgi:hypothetical protein